jgi:hypothetical protein
MTMISACAALTACGPEMEGEPGSEVTEAGEGATGEAAQELSHGPSGFSVWVHPLVLPHARDADHRDEQHLSA